MGVFKRMEERRDEAIRDFLARGGTIQELPDGPNTLQRDIDRNRRERSAARDAWQRRLAWLGREVAVAQDHLTRLDEPTWVPDRLDLKAISGLFYRKKKSKRRRG